MRIRKRRRGPKPKPRRTPKVVPTVCAKCGKAISRFDDYDGDLHARCASKVRIVLEEVCDA